MAGATPLNRPAAVMCSSYRSESVSIHARVAKAFTFIKLAVQQQKAALLVLQSISNVLFCEHDDAASERHTFEEAQANLGASLCLQTRLHSVQRE
jgi:hypothetical protein